MDVDAEMERLAQEAREKREAEERARREAAAESAGSDALDGLDAEATEEARRLAKRPGATMSLGGKIAVAAVAVVGLLATWTLVLKPLLKLAIVVGVLGVLVYGVIKVIDLAGGDDDDEGAE